MAETYPQGFFKVFYGKILEIVFPKRCLGCKIPGQFICPKCRKSLPYPEKVHNGIYAAVSYRSPVIRAAIELLKYKKAKVLGEELAGLIHERFKDIFFRGDLSRSKFLIIPVPLSKKRLRERGFNQAELIARHLSDKVALEIYSNVLYKIRHTASQVELKSRQSRLKNLKGAFAVKRPELVKDKIIFLVDDVSTTGTTLKEASRALKKAGAKKVIGIVLAS